VFYTLLFSLLAVLLIVAAVMTFSRNRRELGSESSVHATSDSDRRQRKAQRTQSKQARRKRH
jgi:hypothetical protein